MSLPMSRIRSDIWCPRNSAKIRPASIVPKWNPLMIYRKAVVAVVLVSLAVPLAFGQQWPKEQIPTPRIRNEINAHESGLAVWWTGHNGWLIRSDALLIGTDLATEDQGRLYQSPITAAELPDARLRVHHAQARRPFQPEDGTRSCRQRHVHLHHAILGQRLPERGEAAALEAATRAVPHPWTRREALIRRP